jgi:hypothetical protein
MTPADKDAIISQFRVWPFIFTIIVPFGERNRNPGHRFTGVLILYTSSFNNAVIVNWLKTTISGEFYGLCNQASLILIITRITDQFCDCKFFLVADNLVLAANNNLFCRRSLKLNHSNTK